MADQIPQRMKRISAFALNDLGYEKGNIWIVLHYADNTSWPAAPYLLTKNLKKGATLNVVIEVPDKKLGQLVFIWEDIQGSVKYRRAINQHNISKPDTFGLAGISWRYDELWDGKSYESVGCGVALTEAEFLEQQRT